MSPNPDIKLFLDYILESFEDKIGDPYNINWPKDGAIAKRLLAVYPLDKLKSLWKIFLTLDDDHFIKKAGFTIGVFGSQINKLLALHRKMNPTKSSREVAPLKEPDEGRIDPKDVRELINKIGGK